MPLLSSVWGGSPPRTTASTSTVTDNNKYTAVYKYDSKGQAKGYAKGHAKGHHASASLDHTELRCPPPLAFKINNLTKVLL